MSLKTGQEIREFALPCLLGRSPIAYCPKFERQIGFVVWASDQREISNFEYQYNLEQERYLYHNNSITDTPREDFSGETQNYFFDFLVLLINVEHPLVFRFDPTIQFYRSIRA